METTPPPQSNDLPDENDDDELAEVDLGDTELDRDDTHGLADERAD